jgi:hypothetical protein
VNADPHLKLSSDWAFQLYETTSYLYFLSVAWFGLFLTCITIIELGHGLVGKSGGL